jgi:hypothetical protein
MPTFVPSTTAPSIQHTFYPSLSPHSISVISTIAGTGTCTFSGDGGAALTDFDAFTVASPPLPSTSPAATALSFNPQGGDGDGGGDDGFGDFEDASPAFAGAAAAPPSSPPLPTLAQADPFSDLVGKSGGDKGGVEGDSDDEEEVEFGEMSPPPPPPIPSPSAAPTVQSLIGLLITVPIISDRLVVLFIFIIDRFVI